MLVGWRSGKLGRVLAARSRTLAPWSQELAASSQELAARSLSSSSQDTAVDFSRAVEDFRTNGVAILPLRMEESFIRKSRELSLAAWQEALLRARLLRGRELEVGMQHGFQELVLRAEGRYDMHWGVNGVAHFLDQENILDKFLPFVHEILGGAHMTKMDFNGCLMSLPGAKEQLWHVDGEHLFSSEPGLQCYGDPEVQFFNQPDRSSVLPAHCLNVFIPLVDVEGSNGGTEFCLGSHFHSKFMGEDIVWQDSSWRDRIGFKGDVMQIKVNAGEVLAFDYRVLHRALRHGGAQARPLLYYTFTKRWFSDAMNFADLPSLREADSLVPQPEPRGLASCREQFPALQEGTGIYCDGAAGTQVPRRVTDRMAQHLNTLGSTNVGGDYNTSQQVLDTVTRAREAGAALLGAASPGEVAFGLNCSNLMFHLARALEDGGSLQPGDNILLSRACHDANIAPWLLLAQKTGLQVRWLETRGGGEDDSRDEVCREQVAGLLDSRTRVVSLGLASNATGRLHTPVLDSIRQVTAELDEKPFLVLDATHWVPHRRTSLQELGADALVCSVYKFFGPHLGLMAFRKERVRGLRPSKAGLRFGEGGVTDLLDYGELPDSHNCQISRWEMGTLNYEALAGFEACVDYLASLAPAGSERSLGEAFTSIREHEEELSATFLTRLRPLLEAGKVRLYGSRQPGERTPTFALAVPASSDPLLLVRGLTSARVRCTHGNHYAVGLVEEGLGEPGGVTRLSFMHYNTLQEVDRVVDILEHICQ